MRKITPTVMRTALGFVLLMGLYSPAAADIVTWTLSNISFSNGDTVTGSFIASFPGNGTLLTLVSDSISISNTAHPKDAFSVTGFVATPVFIDITGNKLADNVAISFSLTDALTFKGGIVPVTGFLANPGFGLLDKNVDPYVSGTLPEPSALIVLCAFLAVLSATNFLRRKWE